MIVYSRGTGRFHDRAAALTGYAPCDNPIHDTPEQILDARGPYHAYDDEGYDGATYRYKFQCVKCSYSCTTACTAGRGPTDV